MPGAPQHGANTDVSALKMFGRVLSPLLVRLKPRTVLWSHVRVVIMVVIVVVEDLSLLARPSPQSNPSPPPRDPYTRANASSPFPWARPDDLIM